MTNIAAWEFEDVREFFAMFKTFLNFKTTALIVKDYLF